MIKLNIDWKGLIKAVVKAAFPFLAGGLTGFLAGCYHVGASTGGLF